VARSAQEHRLGVSSVAVPILDHSGLVAALGLLAPLASARLGNSLAPMRAAAAAISQTFSTAPVHRSPT
jgi:DNA-binding IclR family transcriptional regulator